MTADEIITQIRNLTRDSNHQLSGASVKPALNS